MNNHNYKFLIFSILVSTVMRITHPPSIRGEDDIPSPIDIIKSVYQHPSISYEAHLTINHTFHNQTKGEEVRVYYMPPNLYRMEFISPNGSLDRIVLSDGRHSEVVFSNEKGISQKHTSISRPQKISKNNELNLLLSNYQVSMHPQESVLGRSVWVIQLTPLVLSKPSQILRIDKKTNIILETKRFGQEDSFGSVLRIIEFEPGKKFSTDLFLPRSSLADPNIKPSNDTSIQSDGTTPQLSDTLELHIPGGFSLVDLNQFQSNNYKISHFAYSDGLIPMSLFQTPVPVNIPTGIQVQLDTSSSLLLGTISSGQIYHWNNENTYYTIIGDLPKVFLEQIALSFKTVQEVQIKQGYSNGIETSDQ